MPQTKRGKTIAGSENMKKIAKWAAALPLALCLAVGAGARAADGYPFHGSQEQTYQDAIMGLLRPRIEEAVEQYYKPYFKDTPLPAPYDMTFVNADAMVNDSTMGYPSFYLITVEALPYFGPHISVGRDRLTFRTDNAGRIWLVKFDHLESHELPERYRYEIKDKWPPK